MLYLSGNSGSSVTSMAKIGHYYTIRSSVSKTGGWDRSLGPETSVWPQKGLKMVFVVFIVLIANG